MSPHSSPRHRPVVISNYKKSCQYSSVLMVSMSRSSCLSSWVVLAAVTFCGSITSLEDRLRLLFPPINVLAVSQSTSPASKPADTVFGEVFLHVFTSHQTVCFLLRGVLRHCTKAGYREYTDLPKRTTRNHHTWKYQWPQHQREHHSISGQCSLPFRVP